MKREHLYLKKLVSILVLIILCLQQMPIISLSELDNQEENRLKSNKYLIVEEKGYISRIVPKTTMEELKSNFNYSSETIHVYEDDSLEQEVTEEYIKTGMVLTCDEIEESYDLSVIGDLDKDGELTQIDLNLLIKHVVGLQEEQLEGLSEVSADLSGDKIINQVDITVLIRYIAYHELYIPEIKRPSSPIIEVTKGEEGIEGWYNSEVTVEIRENEETEEKIGKTVYKITGDKTQEETTIEGNSTSITLEEEGEYKITAYSYSEEGAKSEVSSKTVKVDKTAPELSIKTETNLGEIEVKAEAKDTKSGIKDYTYYIGKEDEKGTIHWEEGITTEEASYKFTNLTTKEPYHIKVEVRDKAGNITSKETVNIGENSDDIGDEEVTEGYKDKLTITPSTSGWTNEDVTVKIENKNNKNNVQTSKDGTTWVDESTVVVTENGDVYGRLTDGTNIGPVTKTHIDNIDKEKPTGKITVTNVTTKSMTVKVVGEDTLSGIANIVVYYQRKEGGELYHKEFPYKEVHSEGAGNPKEEETISLNDLENGTYNIYAVVTDVAGNQTVVGENGEIEGTTPKDAEKGEVEGKQVPLTTIPNADETITLTPDITYWINGDVTVTASTNNTEFILQTSIDGKNWTEETVRTLKTNGTVYARLYNGVSGGASTSLEVRNIDKSKPTGKLSIVRRTTSALEVKVEATDSLSGIASITFYCKNVAGGELYKKDVVYKDINGNEKGNLSQEEIQMFDGLINGTYNVYAVVTDVAGNQTVIGENGEIRGKTAQDAERGNVEGNQEPLVPMPQGKDALTITPSTSGWTNEDVTVTVEKNEGVGDEFTIETSKDGENWTEDTTVTFDDNGEVHAKVTDGVNDGEEIVVKVDNIDKEKPTGTVTVTDVTTRSITVKVVGEDTLSGIANIVVYCQEKTEGGKLYKKEFKYKDVHSEDAGNPREEATYTFDELVSGEYNIYAVVTDVAGNQTVVGENGEIKDKTPQDAEKGQVEGKDVPLDPMPQGQDALKVTPSTSGWTNEDVTVTVEKNEGVGDEFTIETSKDGENWTEDNPVIVDENGEVHAKVTDGVNDGEEIVVQVENIDKEKPTGTVTVTDVTTRSITVKVVGEDTLSGVANIVVYCKAKDGEKLYQKEFPYKEVHSEEKGNPREEETYTFDELVSGEYNIYAVVTDVAGNQTVVGENGEIKGTTPDEAEKGEVEGKDIPLTPMQKGEETIEITPDKTYWTNEEVTVTAHKKEEVGEEFNVQTSLDAKEWELGEERTLSENGTVYARLWDGINGGESASLQVENIDKEKPTGTVTVTDVTTKGMKVTIEAHDNASGIANIVIYYQRKEDGSLQEKVITYKDIHEEKAGELNKEEIQILDDLINGTYNVYAVVTDVAGNQTVVGENGEIEGTTPDKAAKGEVEGKEVPLTPMPSAKDSLTITPSTNGWTNEDVTVTVEKNEGVGDEFTIETSKDGTIWTEDTTVTFDDNGEIHAKLTDGVNDGEEIVVQVENIDKEKPTGKLSIENVTTKSMTIKVVGEDALSGVANIVIYYQNKNGGELYHKEFPYKPVHSEEKGNPKEEEIELFDDLTNGTYNVYAVVTDVAGNQTVIGENGEIRGKTPDEAERGEVEGKEVPLTPMPNPNDSISIIPDIAYWTNGEVTVTVSKKDGVDETFILETSVDGKHWTEEKVIVLEKNKTVYARLYDGVNYGATASLEITNIDKIKPTGTVSIVSKTTRGMKLKVNAEDTLSGIAYITFYTRNKAGGELYKKEVLYKNINSTTEGDLSKEETQEFDGLINGAYNVYAVVTDVAGNQTVIGENGEIIGVTSQDAERGEVEGDEIPLTPMPNTEGAIEFTENIEYWTNGEVTVTANKKETIGDEFTIETSLDNEEWTKETVRKFDSNGKVYGRVTDGVNNSEPISYEVTNIDKIKPTGKVSIEGVTTKAVTLKVTAEDTISGIARITFYCKSGSEVKKQDIKYKDVNKTEKGNLEEEASYTFDNLKNGAYNVYAVVTDVAGNQTVIGKDGEIKGKTAQQAERGEVSGEDVTLTPMPSATDGIILTPDTKNWTNDQVTVTASKKPGVSDELRIQTHVANTNWAESTKRIFIENGTIYARLWDGVNAGVEMNLPINNIDTTKPAGTLSITRTNTRAMDVKVVATDEASGIASITFYYQKTAGGDLQHRTVTCKEVPSETAGSLREERTETFDGLINGTYNVYAVVTDVAGNQAVIGETGVITDKNVEDAEAGNVTGKQVTLDAIPTGAAGITLTPDTEEWRNTQVVVTATKNDGVSSELKIQTSIDNQNWNDEVSRTFTTNGTIYARLSDGVNIGTVTSRPVTNMDKLNPDSVTFNTSFTSNTITVNAEATDAPANGTYGMSKIKLYYYSNDGGASWEPIAGTSEKTHTFTGLTHNSGYDIMVKAEDTAGNSSTSAISKVTTDKVSDLDKNNTTIEITPSTGWTKNPVTVKITTTATLGVAKLQYRVGSGKWNNYTDTFTVADNNAVIYARLWDGNNSGAEVTETVKTIDKLAPNKVDFTTTSTSNSITVNATATDAPADATSGQSNIKLYYYRINGGAWEPAQGTPDTTHKFEGLIHGQAYNIEVKAEDYATNSTISAQKSASTVRVSDLNESNTTIDISPKNWTKDPVTVTITTYADLGVARLEYRIGATGAWQEYKQSFTVTDNGKVIQARLWDGTNEGATTSKTIGNIDKLAPNKVTFTIPDTVLKITVNVDAEDAPANTTSGQSNIKLYYYSKNGGQDWEPKAGTGEKTYTFSNLPEDGTYQIRVKVEDNAGNTAESTTQSVKVLPPNVAPVMTNMTYSSKTPNSLTINATATDADGDRLTYKLYAGTDKNNMDKVSEAVTGNAGTQVTLTVTGLVEYTNYYYRVEVSDGKLTDEQTSTEAKRTYCSGTGNWCNGATWVPCWKCDGTGSITCDTCHGSGQVTGTVQCPTCEAYGWGEWYYPCTNCGGHVTGPYKGKGTGYDDNNGGTVCGRCDGSGIVKCPDHRTTGVKDCDDCNGNGTTSCPYGTGDWENCIHQQSSRHQYCDHGQTGWHD